MTKEGILEMGDVILYKGDNCVVESIDYRWMTGITYGHWVTAKKLRKDGEYNKAGKTYEFFSESEPDIRPEGKMARKFVWPKGESPLDKPIDCGTISFDGRTIAVSG